MPFVVEELIAENPIVVVTTPDESVRDALVRMIEHDFSQLPVVDSENRPLGMATSESILRSLTGFDVDLNQLKVEHAIVNADTFRSDADLFELLDRLQDTYAVLIVDGDDRLIGIVTNYDTAEYFRRRAEDIMLVEDIETMLKDYIQAAFIDESGEIDDSHLEEAIQHITDTGKAKRDQFKRALNHYLMLQGGDNLPVKPNDEWLQQVNAKHFDEAQPGKSFDDLTLYEYIELLLDKSRWPNYRYLFHLERGAMRNLLNKVRETRNSLAHFRGEISSAQRDHLRFTANWLAQYQEAVTSPFETTEEIASVEVMAEPKPDYKVPVQESLKPADAPIIAPSDEEVSPRESRFAPLAIWLQSQSIEKKKIKPTFSEIVDIIDSPLPAAAYSHRAWWSNDPVSHAQSQQWLDVGWRVASVNMTDQVVRFARIRERERAYIDFYNDLMIELEKQPAFSNLWRAHDGSSWHWVESIFAGEKYVASFNYSFGRSRTFRIELYIDTGDQEKNKSIFDLLIERKDEIEEAVGSELSWQRLNNRRASRVAIIHRGAITDSPNVLRELRDQAVLSMVFFKEGIQKYVQDVGKSVLEI